MFTKTHPDSPVSTLAGTGYTEERLWSPIIKRGEPGKGSHGKSGKHRRNFRFEGVERPMTRYMASGGPARHDARRARNLRRQMKLTNAERRIDQTNRRLDRRILRAAAEVMERLD